jgi:hypothetical protein
MPMAIQDEEFILEEILKANAPYLIPLPDGHALLAWFPTLPDGSKHIVRPSRGERRKTLPEKDLTWIKTPKTVTIAQNAGCGAIGPTARSGSQLPCPVVQPSR